MVDHNDDDEADIAATLELTVEPPDIVDEYLRLVLDGAKHTDSRFDALLEIMSPDEVQQTQKLVAAVFLRQVAPTDFADLFLALVARGVRPNDLRLVTMAAVMSPDELQRCQTTLGELWLQGEPTPAKPN